jgi:hypothetical protein
MKKISLVLILVFIMILAFAMTVWAEGAVNTKIYFDTWLGANTKLENVCDLSKYSSTYDEDTQSSFLGVDLTVKRFRFTGEMNFGGNIELSNGTKESLEISNYKFGVRVINAEKIKWDLNSGLLMVGGEYYGNENYVGLMMGTDLFWSPSNKVFFQCSYQVSAAASFSDTDYAEMSAFNLKAGFLVTDNFALTAGYRLYTTKYTNYDVYYSNYQYYDFGKTATLSGFTLGIMYKF